MTQYDIKRIIEKLNLTHADLARVLHTELRTVQRWLSNAAEPVGASRAVLVALEELLRRYPNDCQRLADVVRRSVDLGGLAYFVITLYEERYVTKKEK